MRDHRVTVLRLGHRPGRDDRMTTHVGLTARALGADRVVFEPGASEAVATVREVTERFGGPFEAEVADDPMGVLRSWDGPVAHLTMYGLPLQETVEEVRAELDDPAAVTAGGPETDADGEASDGLLAVVGAEKVPFEVYDRADFNVAVTGQPHSEVAALAVFLDRLFEGRELERTWTDARRRVVPQETGKRVVDVDGDADPSDHDVARRRESENEGEGRGRDEREHRDPTGDGNRTG